LLSINAQAASSTAILGRIACTLETAICRRRDHATSREAVSAITLPPVLRPKVRIRATECGARLQRNCVGCVAGAAQRSASGGFGVAVHPLPRRARGRHSRRLSRPCRWWCRGRCGGASGVVDVQLQPVSGTAVLERIPRADHAAVAQRRGGGARRQTVAAVALAGVLGAEVLVVLAKCRAGLECHAGSRSVGVGG